MLTALTFLADLPIYETVKPYQIKGFPDVDDAVRTNVVRIKKDGISVENVRKSSRETEFEECGFRWLKHESKYAIKSDDFEARSDDNPFVLGYLQETMDLIRAELGAKAVFCFDWRIRRNVDSIIDQFEDQDVAYSRHYVAPPVSIVHMDFSKQGGHDRIRAHFTENEYREIEQNHARILMINVWRPFQVVRDAPLALCDRRSVQTNDALEIDEVLPTHVEMEAFVKYRKHHEWYWLADQKPDEPAMFITWDSSSDRVDGGGVPHAACMDVLAEAGQQARESIEVRTMVML